MASVTFSPSVGGDGSTVTDDSNTTTGLANGGHRERFVPALAQVVAVAANTVTKAAEALDSSQQAAGSAATALAAPGTNATSISSLAVGAGSKSLTVQTGKSFVVGMWVLIAQTSNPAVNWMLGQITSYTSGTGALVVLVTDPDYKGSGTYTDWTISISTVRGLSATTAVNLATIGPSIKPSLLLDFANSRYLPGSATFTRSTIGYRTNARGLLESVPANKPRFDFDPTTLIPLGLLVEEQRTQLLADSERFWAASWAKGRANVLANIAVAPDGTWSASKLIEDTTASNTHVLDQGYAATSGTTYTASFFAKAGERAKVALQLSGAAPTTNATFDLSAGTATAGTIQALSNGWYRCSITATTTSTASLYVDAFLHNGTSTSYTGDGVSGLYLWGAMLEAGAFATSYMPSSDSATGRASSATYIGSNGLIQTAGTNVARATYNPLDLSIPPKVLVEPAATNLLTYSEQFDNAAWVKQGATVTANASTAPDGATTMDKLVEDTSTGLHRALQDQAASGSAPITLSVFTKAAERTSFWLIGQDAGASNGAQVRFDLSPGTYGSLSTFGSGSNAFASITNMGGGIYRCTLTVTPNSGTTIRFNATLDNGGGTSYTGTSGSGLYLWGAQLEPGYYATSYIATTSAQVTRAADVYTSTSRTRSADVCSLAVGNWYNASEGTIYAESDVVALNSAASQAVVDISNGTGNQRMTIRVSQPSANDAFVVFDSGATLQAALTASLAAARTTRKYAASYKANDFSFSVDGAAPQTDTSGTVPAVSAIYIGSVGAGGSTLNGHVKKIAYYPHRLTATEQQGMTTL